MTNLPVKGRRSRYMLYGVITISVLIIFVIAYKNPKRLPDPSTPEGQVVAAVLANFPSFCYDGEIIAEKLSANPTPDKNNHDHFWGIKCDSWAKKGGFYGDALIMDADTCTTVRPPGTLGIYYSEFEALNKSNGQKLAVCP